MKKLLNVIISAVFLCVTPSVLASGVGYPLEESPADLNDQASLQHGAKIFVNFCLNCHSAKAVRYNTLRSLGLTDTQIEENLLFTGKKIGDKMFIAMQPKDAKAWLGTTPPDLSVIERAKSQNLGHPGADYIYTYFKTFYRDEERGVGWNNLVFPNVGMPNPLWEEQGPVEVHRKEIAEKEVDGKLQWVEINTLIDQYGVHHELERKVLPDYKGHASKHEEIVYLDKEKQHSYEKDVKDVVNFLTWMAEPHRLKRQYIGYGVLAFLAIFFVIAIMLNKQYWKHVK